MADKAKSLQDLLDLGKLEHSLKAISDALNPIRRAYIDTSLFPDVSECRLRPLLNVPAPAHTASPEALRKINARIATMDLSPQRRTMDFDRRLMGIWNIKEEDDHE